MIDVEYALRGVDEAADAHRGHTQALRERCFGSFEGRTFKYYKGGLFRSDKTEYSALEEETRKAFADTFTAMKDGTKGMAEVLGLGTEAIDGFTAHIKVSLNGLSAEEADKRLKEEFDKIAETLASTTLSASISRDSSPPSLAKRLARPRIATRPTSSKVTMSPVSCQPPAGAMAPPSAER